MPNPETTANAAHFPARPCIHLEDVTKARTSAIDAEWESLSAAETKEVELPTALARPRFETLPGLGPETQPATVQPRLSRRSSSRRSTLAATLALSLALGAVLVLRVCPGVFAPLAAIDRANLVAAATKPALPLSVPGEPLPAQIVAAAEARAAASPPELPSAKPTRNNQPMRPLPAAPGLTAESRAPRWVPARGRHARQVELASSDNPY